MTREIAHFQMFSAALATIEPNFPPGVLQGDPRFTHSYFNMSNGASARGPWNEGQGPWGPGESWQYIDDPLRHVVQSQGLVDEEVRGTSETPDEVERLERELSKLRSQEVKSAVGKGGNQWSDYPQTELASPKYA
jgi:Mn-containing catalase